MLQVEQNQYFYNQIKAKVLGLNFGLCQLEWHKSLLIKVTADLKHRRGKVGVKKTMLSKFCEPDQGIKQLRYSSITAKHRPKKFLPKTWLNIKI